MERFYNPSTLLLSVLFFVLLGAGTGTYLIVRGIKMAIYEQRVVWRGKVLDEDEMVRRGVLSVFAGVAFWGFAALMWWAWKTGRVTW